MFREFDEAQDVGDLCGVCVYGVWRLGDGNFADIECGEDYPG